MPLPQTPHLRNEESPYFGIPMNKCEKYDYAEQPSVQNGILSFVKKILFLLDPFKETPHFILQASCTLNCHTSIET
jgi:hypothetical protein